MLALVILILLCWTSVAWAAVYYVATTGSDSGSGSTRCTRVTNPATPMLTINTALACAVAGDTVQIAAGTYAQRINLNSTAGGTAGGGYVTIQGAKPLGPTVTDITGATKLLGTALGNGWMVFGRHIKYTKIRNLEITGHTGGGIGFFGSHDHVEVTDNYIHDNTFLEFQGSAIRPTARYSVTTNTVQGGDMGTATHITVARNRIAHIRTGFMGNLPNSGSESLTIAGDVSHFLIEDNSIDDGQFIGIGLIGKTAQWWDDNGANTLAIPATSWPRKGFVRRNTVKNLRKGFGASDIGIYCDGCSETIVEQNRVDGTSGYCYAISTEEPDFLISQVIARHNVGMGCVTANWLIGPPQNAFGHGISNHLRLAHNTDIKTKSGSTIFRFFFTDGTKFLNNIGAVASVTPLPKYVGHVASAASTSPQLNYTLYFGGTNFWEYQGLGYLTMATWRTGSGQDANSLVANPLFTNTATGDVTLLTGSPALEAGTPLTRTTATGSGAIVTVLDARWFSDGVLMRPGDPIQVGTQLAVVNAVNYTTNQITLDRSLTTWAANAAVSYPYVGIAPAIGACEGATCTLVTPPPAPPVGSPAPAVALELTHTCATASNALNARVMGSLFYLAPTATYTADTLARSQCASSVAITDSASVLPSAFALVPPWRFLGTAGPNVGNTCTNCLSVHGGTPTVNASGSGYTLTTFRQGTSISAATGGVSAFTALPGLCRQVVDGVVTSEPLWPWPMDARIVAARALAGSSPVEVTLAVEAGAGADPPRL